MPICKTCRHFFENPSDTHVPPLGFCVRADGRREETFRCRRHVPRPHYEESIIVRTVRTVDPVAQIREQTARKNRKQAQTGMGGMKCGRKWIECEDPSDVNAALSSRVRAAIRLYGPIDTVGVAEAIGETNVKKVRDACMMQQRRQKVKCNANGQWSLCGEG